LENCGEEKVDKQNMRKIKFYKGKYYHIYNRGVDKREVFGDKRDYIRFLRSMREFNRFEAIESLYRQDQLMRRLQKETKSLRLFSNRGDLVSFIAYCLNPNHYHLLLQQTADKGIEKFMHKLSISYTQYFNHKYKRSGSLFQGTYKAIAIKTDAQLLYVSAYINGNTEIHGITKAEKWPWSSYRNYLNTKPSDAFVKASDGLGVLKSIILKEFKNRADYKKYINMVIGESGQRKDEIKAYLLE
jgi:putative transposase